MKLLKLAELPLAKLTKLWNEAFSDYIVPIEITEAGLKDRLESLNLSGTDSLVATVEGELAGIMLVGQETFKGEKVAWIGGMGVSPKFRRQGLAESLLLAAIKNLKTTDCQQLLLEVIVGNDRAENLYRQLGFKELNRVSVAHGTVPEISSHNLSFETVSPLSNHFEQEPTLTTWQNRLGRQGYLKNIYQDLQFLGYVFYDVNENTSKGKVVSLKQLILNEDTATNIRAVLAELASIHETNNFQYSNLDVNSSVTTQLLALGFKEQLQQIQMAYEL